MYISALLGIQTEMTISDSADFLGAV